MPGVAGDQGVEDEGVHPAVPSHVDEPDEAVPDEGADPAEAVTLHLCAPIDVQDRMIEALGVERVQLRVLEVGSPFVAEPACAGVS